MSGSAREHVASAVVRQLDALPADTPTDQRDAAVAIAVRRLLGRPTGAPCTRHRIGGACPLCPLEHSLALIRQLL